ncbi:M23 family metallopeptidase [Pseudonocardia oroxyli]|nr:M23 family metallopeptidase [Pseudonocardia oroxyli]
MRWGRRMAAAGLVGALAISGAGGGVAAAAPLPQAEVEVVEGGLGVGGGGNGAERAPVVEYGWPLRPAPAVARRFEEPPFRYGRGHRGADLAAAPGQAVLAARAGEVVFAGPVAGRGVVSVLHPDGLRTTYEPVAATVAVGVRVGLGDPIGTLEPGHAGCPVAACLHWGLRRGSGTAADYLDPLVLLRPRYVRLLPLP